MRKSIEAKLLCITAIMLLLATIPVNAAVTTKEIDSKTGNKTLPAGYYDAIDADASKVYQRGYDDASTTSTVEYSASTITVDPGEHGTFADGSTDSRVYTVSDLSDSSLEVVPTSIVYDFDHWDISVGAYGTVFTAAYKKTDGKYHFSRASKSSTNGGAVRWKAPVDGTYAFTLNGSAGWTSVGLRHTNQGGRGSRVYGEMHLKAGTVLYIYVGRDWGCATDIRLSQNDEKTRIMIAGAGGNAGFVESHGGFDYYWWCHGGNSNGLTGANGMYTSWYGNEPSNSHYYTSGGGQSGSMVSSDGWTINTGHDYAHGYRGWQQMVGETAGGYRISTLSIPTTKADGSTWASGGGSSYVSGYSGCVSLYPAPDDSSVYKDPVTGTEWKFSNITVTGAANTGFASADIQILNMDE